MWQRMRMWWTQKQQSETAGSGHCSTWCLQKTTKGRPRHAALHFQAALDNRRTISALHHVENVLTNAAFNKCTAHQINKQGWQPTHVIKSFPASPILHTTCYKHAVRSTTCACAVNAQCFLAVHQILQIIRQDRLSEFVVNPTTKQWKKIVYKPFLVSSTMLSIRHIALNPVWSEPIWQHYLLWFSANKSSLHCHRSNVCIWWYSLVHDARYLI